MIEVRNNGFDLIAKGTGTAVVHGTYTLNAYATDVIAARAASSSAISCDQGIISMIFEVTEGSALNYSSVYLERGETLPLRLKSPAPAHSHITWTTADSSIAYADSSGVLHAVAEGETDITAWIAVDGGFRYATCLVTVSPP